MNSREIIRIAREFRKGLLGKRSSAGKCGMVVLPLGGLLSFYGVPTQYREVEYDECSHVVAANHCWLELPDGRVLDPTIDQFNTKERKFPPIYLGKRVPDIHILGVDDE